MWVVFVVVAAVVVFAVAAVAVGRNGGLEPAGPDLGQPWLPEHAVTADDVERLHFAVGLRGYRMDQVDSVLDRLATEIARRDARLATLEAAARASPMSSEAEPEHGE